MERYVTTTYRLHELHICVYTRWIRNFTYRKYDIDELNV